MSLAGANSQRSQVMERGCFKSGTKLDEEIGVPHTGQLESMCEMHTEELQQLKVNLLLVICLHTLHPSILNGLLMK